MYGSQESPTGNLKSRRKDERNIGEPLHILESSGNDGNLARPGQSKIQRMLKKNGYHIYNQRQSQKQHKIGITTDQTENSQNLSIPKSRIREDKMRNCSRFGPVAKKILEADARHETFVFCIVHSCVITCIPSSKTLPPGRLLNFTEIHQVNYKKSLSPSIKVNPPQCIIVWEKSKTHQLIRDPQTSYTLFI